MRYMVFTLLYVAYVIDYMLRIYLNRGVKTYLGYCHRKFYLLGSAISPLNDGVHQASNAEAFSPALYI